MRYGTIAVQPNASLSGDCPCHRPRSDRFLPVSSSAHLELVPWLFGWKDPGLSFDIALHVGTFAAVIIYFWKDWVQIVAQASACGCGDRELEKSPNLLWLLVIGSIPVGIAGLLFEKQAEAAGAILT